MGGLRSRGSWQWRGYWGLPWPTEPRWLETYSCSDSHWQRSHWSSRAPPTSVLQRGAGARQCRVRGTQLKRLAGNSRKDRLWPVRPRGCGCRSLPALLCQSAGHDCVERHFAVAAGEQCRTSCPVHQHNSKDVRTLHSPKAWRICPFAGRWAQCIPTGHSLRPRVASEARSAVQPAAASCS